MVEWRHYKSEDGNADSYVLAPRINSLNTVAGSNPALTTNLKSITYEQKLHLLTSM